MFLFQVATTLLRKQRQERHSEGKLKNTIRERTENDFETNGGNGGRKPFYMSSSQQGEVTECFMGVTVSLLALLRQSAGSCAEENPLAQLAQPNTPAAGATDMFTDSLEWSPDSRHADNSNHAASERLNDRYAKRRNTATGSGVRLGKALPVARNSGVGASFPLTPLIHDFR